jgi:hypothetical protein
VSEPLIFVRYAPGIVGERRRSTHLVPKPDDDAEELTALCGDTFAVSEIEVLFGQFGTPCALCLLRSPGPDDQAVPSGPRPPLVPGLFRTSA